MAKPDAAQPSVAELPIGQLNAVLELLLLLPRMWLLTAVLVILLSMVDIAYSAQIGWSFSFGIKSITAVMFGLIWLPVLLRILAVSGGGIKTGAGEATTPGLLSLLPQLIVMLESVEPTLDPAEQEQVALLRQAAEQEWGALTVTDEADARQQLQSLTREYEEVRRVMPSGTARTLRMREIAARVRALTGQANYGADDMQRLFHQGRDGDRMVALCMLHRMPYPACFNLVVEAIARPHSAFEQFAALRAADKMLPALDSDQRQQLHQVILDQQQGGPGQWLTPADQPRWDLGQQIVRTLEHP